MYIKNICEINNNINFILSHFKEQEFIFPRKIITYKIPLSIRVNTREEITDFFLEAELRDCKINVYPYLDISNDSGILSPSIIFIDLSLSSCLLCKYPHRKLDYILNYTLKKMKDEIDGHPTVLWNGDGYHIYQPIRLEYNKTHNTKIFEEFEFFNFMSNYNLFIELIRYSNKFFTDNKISSSSIHSTNLSFLSIPGSINSECKETVRVIKKWDGIISDANSMIPHFLEWLHKKKRPETTNI